MRSYRSRKNAAAVRSDDNGIVGDTWILSRGRIDAAVVVLCTIPTSVVRDSNADRTESDERFRVI